MLAGVLVHQLLCDDKEKEKLQKDRPGVAVVAVDPMDGSITTQSELEIVSPLARKWLQERGLLVVISPDT